MIACHCMKYAGVAQSHTRQTLCMQSNDCMAKPFNACTSKTFCVHPDGCIAKPIIAFHIPYPHIRNVRNVSHHGCIFRVAAPQTLLGSVYR